VKAGAKSAGVAIDAAAAMPRYVLGLSAAREIPIVAKIARGSLRNKLVALRPISLALSAFASCAIMPLLMLGGAYLCYEGAEISYGVRAYTVRACDSLPSAGRGHGSGAERSP
jgi:predicted DNA repair protein MutK